MHLSCLKKKKMLKMQSECSTKQSQLSSQMKIMRTISSLKSKGWMLLQFWVRRSGMKESLSLSKSNEKYLRFREWTNSKKKAKTKLLHALSYLILRKECRSDQSEKQYSNLRLLNMSTIIRILAAVLLGLTVMILEIIFSSDVVEVSRFHFGNLLKKKEL